MCVLYSISAKHSVSLSVPGVQKNSVEKFNDKITKKTFFKKMKFSNRCGQILVAGCLLLLMHQNHCFVEAYFESEQIEQKYETVDESDTLQALSNDQSTSQIQQQQQQQQSQQQSSQLQHQIQQQQQSQLILDQQQSASNSDNEQIAQNVVQIQQQPQHQSQLANTISTSDQNRLNEIYNRLASQAIPKSFRQQEQESELSSASSYQSAHSLQGGSNDETQSSSSSEYGMYQPIQHGGGFGGGLSKITQIPQGSMFAFPDKNGKLEFESMYAKQPYSIVFRTQSMPVKIKQQHQTLPAPEVEFVRSQEEAHRIKHEVIRPVIQEVHEIIQPYRRVIQEVRPVIENVHTIVAKGEPRGSGGAGGGGGGGGSGLGGGLGLKGAGIGRGGGGYPDNLSGSYSENRAVKFMPINEQEQTQPRSTHYQQPQPASAVHREPIHPQQQFHQRSFRSHLTESSSLRPKSGRYSSAPQQRRF